MRTVGDRDASIRWLKAKGHFNPFREASAAIGDELPIVEINHDQSMSIRFGRSSLIPFGDCLFEPIDGVG